MGYKLILTNCRGIVHEPMGNSSECGIWGVEKTGRGPHDVNACHAQNHMK